MTLRPNRKGTSLASLTSAWSKLPLIVDSGATNVVLPSSTASEFGFDDANRGAAGHQSTPARTAATIRGTTPAPAATPPAAFRVQLGAFRIAENAPAVWRRLRVAQHDLLGGLRQRIHRAGRGERIFHLLQVGPLADSEATKVLCAALTARGVDCLVVKS